LGEREQLADRLIMGLVHQLPPDSEIMVVDSIAKPLPA
jgi:hypothetical protein